MSTVIKVKKINSGLRLYAKSPDLANLFKKLKGDDKQKLINCMDRTTHELFTNGNLPRMDFLENIEDGRRTVIDSVFTSTEINDYITSLKDTLSQWRDKYGY